MRIQTFSIVAGTRACDARCPFCVSRMTGFEEVAHRRRIDRRNLAKAAQLAERAGTTTVLFTGKGEPTLYPDEITEYLELLEPFAFPLIEIQTNALAIGRLARDGRSGTRLEPADLRDWYRLGMNTVAVSVVDVHAQANARVYDQDYPDLATTVGYLHEQGFSVRLCVMMQREFVDGPVRLEEVVDFCRDHGVEQLTVRPIRRPEASEDHEAAGWVERHGLVAEEIDAVARWAEEEGTLLLSLMHGARVYDLRGQNLCVSDCLTVDATADDVRTLIFYGDGRLTYDWQYDGAVLLGEGRPAEAGEPV